MAEEFKDEFYCIRENMEKYITFLVAIKKECDNKKSSIYKLTFIDSFRFLQTSSSNLVDNVSEIYKKGTRKMHGKKKTYMRMQIY